MTGPGTPLRSSLPSSSSLRAGNCTPCRYLPTWEGKRFLKKSTVLCLLLFLVDWQADGTARRGTPTSALRCSANFAFTEFSVVRAERLYRQSYLGAVVEWRKMGWANSIARACTLIVLLVAVSALTACGKGGQDPAASAPEPGRVDPSVEKFLEDTLPEGTSGTVVAARDGSIAHCRGFGLADREAKVAAGCDTVYDTMSMTKQFTAAAILKLEMMGKLSVSDPISKFVGPVPDDKRAITLHHLLTHTAGLTEQLGGDYEALSRREMLDG